MITDTKIKLIKSKVKKKSTLLIPEITKIINNADAKDLTILLDEIIFFIFSISSIQLDLTTSFSVLEDINIKCINLKNPELNISLALVYIFIGKMVVSNYELRLLYYNKAII